MDTSMGTIWRHSNFWKFGHGYDRDTYIKLFTWVGRWDKYSRVLQCKIDLRSWPKHTWTKQMGKREKLQNRNRSKKLGLTLREYKEEEDEEEAGAEGDRMTGRSGRRSLIQRYSVFQAFSLFFSFFFFFLFCFAQAVSQPCPCSVGHGHSSPNALSMLSRELVTSN